MSISTPIHRLFTIALVLLAYKRKVLTKSVVLHYEMKVCVCVGGCLFEFHKICPTHTLSLCAAAHVVESV